MAGYTCRPARITRMIEDSNPFVLVVGRGVGWDVEDNFIPN